MEWRERWDRASGSVKMKLVPRPLFKDYPGAVEYWECEGEELARREGFDWRFWSEYCLTGYQGRNDSEPTLHPYDGPGDQQTIVRDEAHLHELLTAAHLANRPKPEDHMPVFAEGTAVGWCMYETCSEGTPISPVFEDPDALAHWLADNGASAFGYMTATYEEWLATVRAGWAPSAVSVGGETASGVEHMAKGA